MDRDYGTTEYDRGDKLTPNKVREGQTRIVIKNGWLQSVFDYEAGSLSSVNMRLTTKAGGTFMREVRVGDSLYDRITMKEAQEAERSLKQ